MQNDLLQGALVKNDLARSAPGAGRENTGETLHWNGSTSEDQNAQIANLLLGLTAARKTRSFGPRFVYLRNVQGHGWSHKRA